MKFFTPDLLERFGSEDDERALAAHQEFEQRSEEYAQKLLRIELKLPQRVRELQDQFYLHDARVKLLTLPDFPRFGSDLWLYRSMPRGLALGFLAPGEEHNHLPSVWMVLQLDTPPHDLLVLHYQSVLIKEVDRPRPFLEESCPYLEWLYDEVDLLQTDQGIEFDHSILFTNSFELHLRFRDFDFATLKPMEEPRELWEASCPPASS
jgi:hypothetical protein